MLTSLPEEDQRAIYAGAFLLYAREVSDWSPPPFDEARRCGCRQCAQATSPGPRRGSAGWFADMHRRHRLLQRGQR